MSLTVSDRERSAAFYGAHFGLTSRVHDDEHLLILGSGDGSLLALSEGSAPAGMLPPTNHFGFQVAEGGDVRAAREALRSAGVGETDWQDDGRFVRVQVADPDGYRVELFAFERSRTAAGRASVGECRRDRTIRRVKLRQAEQETRHVGAASTDVR